MRRVRDVGQGKFAFEPVAVRKRLVQDTIVVLVTVFLMTLFLFLVDILWIKILSNPVVDVLKIDPQAERQKQNQQAQW